MPYIYVTILYAVRGHPPRVYRYEGERTVKRFLVRDRDITREIKAQSNRKIFDTEEAARACVVNHFKCLNTIYDGWDSVSKASKQSNSPESVVLVEIPSD